VRSRAFSFSPTPIQNRNARCSHDSSSRRDDPLHQRFFLRFRSLTHGKHANSSELASRLAILITLTETTLSIQLFRDGGTEEYIYSRPFQSILKPLENSMNRRLNVVLVSQFYNMCNFDPPICFAQFWSSYFIKKHNFGLLFFCIILVPCYEKFRHLEHTHPNHPTWGFKWTPHNSLY
jgi:hypothetical protein